MKRVYPHQKKLSENDNLLFSKITNVVKSMRICEDEKYSTLAEVGINKSWWRLSYDIEREAKNSFLKK